MQLLESSIRNYGLTFDDMDKFRALSLLIVLDFEGAEIKGLCLHILFPPVAWIEVGLWSINLQNSCTSPFLACLAACSVINSLRWRIWDTVGDPVFSPNPMRLTCTLDDYV